MKENSANKSVVFDDYMGCFGEFDMRDPICRNFCALKLRCAVECFQNDQLEIWEDMATASDIRFVF